uniref:N-acyl-aromatic-L-amino acid amidohydrolase n=1 Tax=Sinocyclocheilus rhinocerous TaxID=307959 RepID=A0A673GD55_9TELE
MALVFLPALARMAVCGGTHGNELSGVYVVQEMERQRKEKGEGVLEISSQTICGLYIYFLNNSSLARKLCSPITDSSPYEVRRAQELNNLLGLKGSTDAIDLICDLHNTTSNMGLTLIHYTSSDWVTLHICKYLQTKITKVPVRVLVLDVPISDAYSLESVSKHGFSLEVGPQPHGVVRADIYIIMKEAVDLTIDWIHKFNSGTVFEGGDVEAFKFIKSVDYPRDPETRTLTAAIHPQLQDKDFCLLKRGDPLFLSFSGETVNYEEEETLHPFFINEAAYYEKGIAFHLGKKMMLTIPTVRVQKD